MTPTDLNLSSSSPISSLFKANPSPSRSLPKPELSPDSSPSSD